MMATCVQSKQAAVFIYEVNLCIGCDPVSFLYTYIGIHYECYSDWNVPYNDERVGLIFICSKTP